MKYQPEHFTPKERIIPTESTPEDTQIATHNQYRIDIYKLIACIKDYPVITIPIASLQQQLDIPCWSDTDDQQIAPREILERLREAGGDYVKMSNTYPNLAKHAYQIAQANYEYPITIFEGEVIDGIHRLCKATLENQDKIKARELTVIPVDALVN